MQSLRPNWLRTRGPQSIYRDGQIVVYQDNVRVGGPEALRVIPATDVLSMRFFDGPSATQRWGLDHGHGAIQVLTRR